MNIDIPTLVMAMLSEDFIFFNEDDIAWDEEKREHFFKGAQANASKAEMLDSVVRAFDFDGIAEFAFALQGILLGLEADKQLVVPRSMVAQGVRQGLPEGDLTGISLASLAACGHALKFAKQESDSYLVMYDVRLAQGIPCFFDLVARMLWDLREVEPDLSGKSFAIGFASCRNFDADQYFGEVASPVAGAQAERCVMQVNCAPEINLGVSSSGSVEIQDSGVLDVEKPGHDMANDAKLLEALSAAGQSAASVSDAKPSYEPVGKAAKAVCQAGAQRVASAMSLVIAEKVYHEALDARDAAKYELKNAEKALEQREKLLSNFKAERAAYEKLKADIDEVEADANKFADEVSFYQKQIEGLTAEINRVEGKLEAVTQEIAQTSAFSFGRRSALKSKQEALQGELNAAKRKRKGIEDESHESSLCLMEDRAYLRENKEKLGDMEQRIARMKEEIDKSVDEAGKMRVRVDKAKVAFEQADKAYEEARERYMNVAD